MPTVWFIRHAECETNVGLPTADATTAQLTPKGIKQAEQIASALSRCPDLIISSSYLRAKQTVEYTRQRFPHAPVEEWPVHEFTYLSQSVSGRSTTIDERRTLVDEYWSRLDQHYTDGNGAESFTNLMKRVRDILEQLKNTNAEFIVVFSHGQFILAVLSWLMGLNINNMEQFRHFLLANEIPNGAIMKVVLEQQDAWVSQFITAHLHTGL
ncbi:MAG TPA: histidine phosphatase family protein [Ktedonobacteraceae bacterium]|jgi:probable phosphoglycerate mutase